MARNLGIKAATSRLVAILDSDDLWHPHKLKRQLALRANAVKPTISVCGYHRFQETFKKIVQTRTPPNSISLNMLWRGNSIPLSSVIIDREQLILAKGFNPEHHENYGLWLRLFDSSSPPDYFCIPEPLLAYRLHAKSLSSNRYRSILAVNKLFIQHEPQRMMRQIRLARWAIERAYVSRMNRTSTPLPHIYMQSIQASHIA